MLEILTELPVGNPQVESKREERKIRATIILERQASPKDRRRKAIEPGYLLICMVAIPGRAYEEDGKWTEGFLY